MEILRLPLDKFNSAQKNCEMGVEDYDRVWENVKMWRTEKAA